MISGALYLTGEVADMKKINRLLDMKAVEEHRREDCLHYDGCLEEASALLWPSFSCCGCKLFEERIEPAPRFEQCASPLAWDC
jgi:hypothetical protein